MSAAAIPFLFGFAFNYAYYEHERDCDMPICRRTRRDDDARIRPCQQWHYEVCIDRGTRVPPILSFAECVQRQVPPRCAQHYATRSKYARTTTHPSMPGCVVVTQGIRRPYALCQDDDEVERYSLAEIGYE
eukprot:COSAG06_NODE_4677_length_4043_cov_3.965264_6_plen_131_part_00